MATTVTPPSAEGQLPPVQQAPPTDPKISQLERDLADQRRITQQLQSQLPRQVQPSQQSQLEDANRQFYKEPVQMATAIARQAAQEALAQHGQSGRETLIQVARDKARERNPEMFDKYKEEIELRVKSTVDAQFHDNVNVWANALNLSVGEHIREITDAARAQDPTKQAPAIKISEGGPGAAGGHQAAAAQTATAKLSADELAMAKNLDITPELYAKGKEDYANQNTRGASSWDPHVTFSSKDKERVARAKRRAAVSK